MPTNTPGSTARELSFQAVHYMRKSITFADDGTAVTVGVLPAGALIHKDMSGVAVTQAFDAGTTNTLNVGTAADGDLFGTLLAVGATTFVPLDETVGGYLVTEDTTITATVVLTGTAATAGTAEVVIAYIPDNDG